LKIIGFLDVVNGFAGLVCCNITTGFAEWCLFLENVVCECFLYVSKLRLLVIDQAKNQGVKKYPLVLMLEPLFKCNLACAGCGKIDYPDDILDKRLSVQECLDAVDECGAPMVSIPGGEPLIHKEMPQIVEGIIARKKFVYLCTNALLLRKRIDDYKPSPYLTFSVHLDGNRDRHDTSVCQKGVFDIAVEAIKLALSKGFSCHCQLHAVSG